MALTEKQLELLENQLRARSDVVTETLHRKVARARDESYAELAERSADARVLRDFVATSGRGVARFVTG